MVHSDMTGSGVPQLRCVYILDACTIVLSLYNIALACHESMKVVFANDPCVKTFMHKYQISIILALTLKATNTCLNGGNIKLVLL